MDNSGSKRRLRNSISLKTPIIPRSSVLHFILERFRERKSFAGGGVGSSTQRSSGGRRTNAGFLQQDLCCHQSLRRISSNNRSFSVKQLCQENQVSYGNNSNGPGCRPKRRLDGLSGSPRCLPPRTNPPKESKVSPICMESEGSPIQSPMFRPDQGSTSIHQNHGSDFGLSPQARNSPTSIPRRLAPPGLDATRSARSDPGPSSIMPSTRDSHQSPEIIISSSSEDDLFGSGDSDASFEGFPVEDQGRSVSGHSPSLLNIEISNSQDVVISSGTHGIAHSSHSKCSTKNEGSTISTKISMVKTHTRRLSTDQLDRRQPEGSQMVETGVQLTGREESSRHHDRPPTLHGCLFPGMGGFSSPPHGGRALVNGGVNPSYQHPGVTSGGIGAPSFPASVNQQNSGCMFGQHYSSSLPLSPGRNSLDTTQWRGTTNSTLGRGEIDLHPDPIHQWDPQCGSRLTQQKESDAVHGVDIALGRLPLSMEDLGQPNDRPVCNQSELQTSKLCITVPRSIGDSNGCIPLQLGSQGPLCIPTVSDDTKSSQQTMPSSGHISHTNSSVLATQGVVPRPNLSRCSQTTADTEGPSTAATLPSLPQRTPHTSTNRVETIKRLLRHQGYSRRVARFMEKARRRSTNVNYQYKWMRFRQWCKRKVIGFHHHQARSLLTSFSTYIRIVIFPYRL